MAACRGRRRRGRFVAASAGDHMGVITHRTSIGDVSASKGQRIDSRYHFLRSRTIAPLGRVAPVRSILDEAESIANGLNLPSSTYAETVDDAEAHYASVAALSQ